MPKSKSKSRARTAARETLPTAPKAKRGTQHEANLRAILANRAAKPKLADLKSKKAAALQLRDTLKERDLGVIAKSSSTHAQRLQREISKVEADYQSRAEKGRRTRAAKTEAQQATLKALAGGRDQLRAHARKLGISGRSRMSVPELRSAVAKAAVKSGTKLGAAAMIAAPVTAALLAWDATKNTANAAGRTGSTADAAMAALKAGTVTGAIGIGIAAGLSAADKAAPKVIARGIPYLGETLMAAGAAHGIATHGLKGAAFGALGAEGLLDLPMSPKAFAEKVNPTSAYMSERIDADFATANSAYNEMQVAKQRSTNTLRGTQNPANQAAIIANRQARDALIRLPPKTGGRPSTGWPHFFPEHIDVEKERCARCAAEANACVR